MEVTNTEASLTFNNGTTTHGLVVNNTDATLSGGTSSTFMVLDDSGATFSTGAKGSGVPAKVTGVADGKTKYDAVNKGQLDDIEEQNLQWYRSRCRNGIHSRTDTRQALLDWYWRRFLQQRVCRGTRV